MAKQSAPKVYQVRSPFKITLKILLAIVLVLVVFAVFLYVYFQRFIVYTEDGLRLDIAGYYAQAEAPEASPSPDVSDSPA